MRLGQQAISRIRSRRVTRHSPEQRAVAGGQPILIKNRWIAPNACIGLPGLRLG
jgi:hypothetical protein